MSEWRYGEKSDIIRDVKDTKRATNNVEQEVKRLQKQVDEMIRNQEAILKAFQEMSREVAAMREELYPSVKNTKPSFDAPKNGMKRR